MRSARDSFSTNSGRRLRIYVVGIFSLLFLTSFGAPLVLHASATTAAQSYSACNASLTPKAMAIQAQIDSNAAISLAENDAGFKAAVNGQTYAFSEIAPSYSFDTSTCSDLTVNAISVNFYLADSSYACGDTQMNVGIQVFENPSLTNVSSVQVNNGECHSSGDDKYWAGYQVHTTYGGVQTNQIYSTMSYTQPTLTNSSSSDPYCTQYSPYICAVDVWTGLSNAVYSTSTGVLIAQTGTTAQMNCNVSKCPSAPSYYGWYELLDTTYGNNCPPADTVSTGDSMQAEAENGDYFGGSSSNYETFLFEDTGTGWICSSGTMSGSGLSITNYAESIVERPIIDRDRTVIGYFNSGSSVTLSGSEECYYDVSQQCAGYYSDIQTEITMQNTCNSNTYNNVDITSALDSSSDFSATFNSGECASNN
jgi:hypothetical protein